MSDETKNITSNRLKLAMSLRHAKQIDLVNSTGICRSTINTYYNGLVAPKSKAAFKIANYLMVSPTWLMGITDDDGPEQVNASAIDSEDKDIEKNSLIDSIIKNLHALPINDLRPLSQIIANLAKCKANK